MPKLILPTTATDDRSEKPSDYEPDPAKQCGEYGEGCAPCTRSKGHLVLGPANYTPLHICREGPEKGWREITRFGGELAPDDFEGVSLARCDQRSPNGLHCCTRTKGHDGGHVSRRVVAPFDAFNAWFDRRSVESNVPAPPDDAVARLLREQPGILPDRPASAYPIQCPFSHHAAASRSAPPPAAPAAPAPGIPALDVARPGILPGADGILVGHVEQPTAPAPSPNDVAAPEPCERLKRQRILEQRIALCPDGLDPRGWAAAVLALGEVQQYTISHLEDPYTWSRLVADLRLNRSTVNPYVRVYRRAIELDEPRPRTQIFCQTDEDP